MTVPSLKYGYETWTLLRTDISKVHASEMRFLRDVKSCSLRDVVSEERGHKEKDPKVISAIDRIKEYRQNWKSHVERMVDTRFLKQLIVEVQVSW